MLVLPRVTLERVSPSEYNQRVKKIENIDPSPRCDERGGRTGRSQIYMPDSFLTLSEDPDFDGETPWKLLIVDDEPDVHSATRLGLWDFEFDGRAIQFLSAYSGEEARKLLNANPDIAVILLDVVMETDDSGLEFAKYVREELGNETVRILLRTGQAGTSPPRKVIVEYDINDYLDKVQLTLDRLFTSVYAAMRSLSGLLKLEQARIHEQELNDGLLDANRKLEGFAHMAAHDLKAPLRKISARVLMLESALPEALDDDAQQSMEAIRHHSRYMIGLIDSMLEYARLNEISLNSESVELGEIFGRAITNLEPGIEEAQGTILTPETCPSVQADAELLVLVFQNLFSNGLKFRQPNLKPVIEVTTGKLESHPDIPGECVEIDVKDNGCGIPKEHTADVFAAFVRGEDSRGTLGSGLGLSIAKNIVESHGGVISLSSEEDKGSTFKVILPVEGPAPGTAAESAADPD